MSCLSNGKYQNFRAHVCYIGVFIVKIPFLCRKWVWRAAIARCHVALDQWLLQPVWCAEVITCATLAVSDGCLDQALFVCTACVLWGRMRISSTLERLGGQCCVFVMCVIVQQIFLSLVVRLVVFLRENAAVSVCELLFLAEQSRCTFVLWFVCFNVTLEVTEIGRISVVMHVFWFRIIQTMLIETAVCCYLL